MRLTCGELSFDLFSGKTKGWLCIGYRKHVWHFLGIKTCPRLPLGWSVEPYELCLDYFSPPPGLKRLVQ